MVMHMEVSPFFFVFILLANPLQTCFCLYICCGLKFFELFSILFAIVPDYGNEYTTKENKNWTSFKTFAPNLNYLNHNIYLPYPVLAMPPLLDNIRDARSYAGCRQSPNCVKLK